MELQRIIELADQSAHTEGFRNKSTGKYSYRKIAEPITPEKLLNHLDDKQALGMYLNVDDDLSHFIVLDFDDHAKEGIARMPTLTVANFLREVGMPHLIFRSGGGWGYHIWLAFEEARSVATLHKYADAILSSIGDNKERYVRVSSGSLNKTMLNAAGKKSHIKHGVEVLPKGTGLQNVAIPCARESVPMRVENNGSIAELVECTIDELEFEFVPVAEQTVAAREIGDEDRQSAFECYIKHFNVDDYCQWGTAGLALVAAFGQEFDPGTGTAAEWAYDRWVEWSKTGSTYKQGDEGQWTEFKPKKYSKLTFWRIATQHGYKGPWPGVAKKDKVSEEDIAEFNEHWALMNVEGKVEYLNLDTRHASNLSSFLALTEPEGEIRDKWSAHPGRRMFVDYVIESPEYDGPGFNIFNGWPVEPEDGDASLWAYYIKEIVCGGDEGLAHWVTSYLADGVQRPWSKHPGTCLGLRGDPGGGKSFLGRAMRKILGSERVMEFASSSRFAAQFNRRMFGATFVLGEESFFAGDKRMASLLKAFIESPVWEYEQKQLASFEGKNVHRLIATTNDDQVAHADSDDRRWTIAEVVSKCPHDTRSKAAIEWWQPYYDLVDKHPGVVLKYLLEYPVDRNILKFPYHTRAKDEDIKSSDPLLDLLVDLAITGVAPHDQYAEGKISTKTLAEEFVSRGGSRQTPARRLANIMRQKYGAQSAVSCVHIEKVETRQDGNGALVPVVTKRADRTGVQLPPLPVFRKMVTKLTGDTFDKDGEWLAYKVASPLEEFVDPNGGNADDVERFVIDQGVVQNEDRPF